MYPITTIGGLGAAAPPLVSPVAPGQPVVVPAGCIVQPDGSLVCPTTKPSSPLTQNPMVMLLAGLGIGAIAGFLLWGMKR